MPLLDTAFADIVAANPTVLDAVHVQAQNENFHGNKRVTIALHGLGGNEVGVANWCYDAVGGAYDNLQMVVAPSAAGGAGWWHAAKSFNGTLTPTSSDLTAPIAAIKAIIDAIMGAGVPMSQIAIVGHSQGGCLVPELLFEYLTPLGASPASPPERFAMAMILSSGMVGLFQNDHTDCVAHAWYQGKIYGQKVHIAAHEVDGTVPTFISQMTANILRDHCGADVTFRLDPSTGHGLMDDDQPILDAAFS